MTRAGIVFLIVVIINCLIAAVYLLWYLVFKRDQDNRKQYIMHTVIMVLCPVIGPLFFLCGFLKYHFLRFGDRDLSDVEFSKSRHNPRLKADEERERNIVPVEEAILISDKEKKRKNMLNVLLGETDEALSSIAMALNSDDSEVAHYAASFLQSKLDVFREHVRQARQIIQEKENNDESCEEDILILIRYMEQLLKQKVLTQLEQTDYVGQMEGLCQKIYDTAKDQLDPGCYSGICRLLIDLKAYDRAEIWGERFAGQYPDQLQAYKLRMRLYFEAEDKEKFFETLGQLKASNVVIDNQTLKLIRMVQQ